jgi:hypothetical protein
MLFGHFEIRFHAAGTITWDGPWGLAAGPLDRRSTIQTGGPDGDDDESALVWKLVALDTILVLLAVVFGV